MQKNAVVIIADVRGSKKMANDERYEGQLFLKSAIIQINENFSKSIEAPFMITRGDEFQGVTKDLASGLEIMLEFERLLFPLKLRYGIGKGEIQKMGSSIPIEMDGPAFHRANDAVNRAKKKKLFLLCNSGDEANDILINNIFLLMNSIKSRWNENNYERYWNYKSLGTFDKVAKKENVSPQAIWDSMQNMRTIDIITAENELLKYFNKIKSK
jgi:hypothetical protein